MLIKIYLIVAGIIIIGLSIALLRILFHMAEWKNKVRIYVMKYGSNQPLYVEILEKKYAERMNLPLVIDDLYGTDWDYYVTDEPYDGKNFQLKNHQRFYGYTRDLKWSIIYNKDNSINKIKIS